MKAPQDSPALTAACPERARWGLLLRDLVAAVDSARRRSLKAAAWRELHDASADATLPYTPRAIALLERFHDLDRHDGDAVHHLAIAYHAMAWDLELRGDEGAPQAWRKALEHWKKLKLSKPFWRQLIARGESLGAGFDGSVIEEFRGLLVERLLDVHVELIRHHCETMERQQALRQVALIKQSAIPPASRKQLAERVYEAMVPAGRSLAVTERPEELMRLFEEFLGLFPHHVPALRSFIEVSKAWLSQLSPASQWESIVALEERISPYWQTLKSSAGCFGDPLAKAALEDLAGTLGRKYWGRARRFRAQREEKSQPGSRADEELRACEGTIAWVTEANVGDREGQVVLLNAFMSRAELKAYVGLGSNDPAFTYPLLGEAVADCERAMALTQERAPRDLAAQILQCRAQRRLAEIAAGGSESRFHSELGLLEEDLERALQLDPESTVVKEDLERVRELFGDL
jgi:hypothetical protein